jgi:hypothetical protein
MQAIDCQQSGDGPIVSLPGADAQACQRWTENKGEKQTSKRKYEQLSFQFQQRNFQFAIEISREC